MEYCKDQNRNTFFHYCIASLLFALYGIQVCPFTAALDRLQLVAQVFILFSLMMVVRYWITQWIQQQSLSERASAMIRLEFGLFVCAGLFYGAFNYGVNGFPLASGVKIFIGIVALGFFISLEQTITYQLALSQHLAEQKKHMELGQNAWSLTAKFGIFATIQAIIVFSVLLLVIIKDLEWLGGVGNTISNEDARLAVLTEIAFVAAVMLGYTLRIISSYARNQCFLLNEQNQALQAIAKGRRDLQVPVTSNDELGRISELINVMVKKLVHREQEITVTRDTTILGLASLAEARDNETGAHILRTQEYVRLLAEKLQDHPDFSVELNSVSIDLLFKSAPLHDIGKVGIPDNILLKPGKLTDDEFEVMKQHVKIGSHALSKAEKELGSNSFLRLAREIVETHHEKWDGSGYPQGLKKDAIPVSGRLMALADVYDALISKRVYKLAFSHDRAKAIIIDGASSHFDPRVVDAFLNLEVDFENIAKRFSDELGVYS